MEQLLALLIPILVLRWVVWRDRWKVLTKDIDTLKSTVTKLQSRLYDLEVSAEETSRHPASEAKAPPPLPVSADVVTTAPRPQAAAQAPEPEPRRDIILPRGYRERVEQTLARADSTAAAKSAPAETEPVPEQTPGAEPSEPSATYPWATGGHETAAKTGTVGGLIRSLGAGLKSESEAWRSEGLSWEAVIGTRWLDKIGIIILTIGMVLFLGYSLQHLGPAGKVATGFLTGLGLIAAGVYLEKGVRYRLLSKPLLGGGWAISYFTAFAAHNLPPARIIDDPVWALLLLLLIAAGIIAHSFRYRSQVLTSLAYGLGFLAISISPMTGFSLITSAILAASLVVNLRILPWYHLGLVGVAGTYLIHLIWMGGGIRFLPLSLEAAQGWSPMGLGEDGFWFTQAILILYWLIFTASAFLRRPQGRSERQLAIAVSVANSIGFLGLSGWRLWVVSPGDFHLLALTSAIAYGATAYLLSRARSRWLQLLNGSIAVTLLAVAVPLALHRWSWSYDWLALMWLAEAAFVLAIGYRSREIVYRVEGHLLSAAVFVAILIFNLQGSPVDRHAILALTLIPAVVLFYFLHERIQNEAGPDREAPDSRELGIGYGYLAAIILAGLIWQEVRQEFVGLAWLMAGLLLFEAGARFSRVHLRIQGYLHLLLAAGGMYLINFRIFFWSAPDLDHTLWISVAPAIPLVYLFYWRLTQGISREKLSTSETASAEMLIYVATALLVPLVFREFPLGWVGLIFMAIGLAFFETGLARLKIHLRIQGYILLSIAIVELLYVNTYGFSQLTEAELPSRWATVLPSVFALYFLYWQAWTQPMRSQLHRIEGLLADIPSYVATFLFAALVWNEFDTVVVAPVWALYGLMLFELGSRFQKPALKHQGHILESAAVLRLFMINFAVSQEVMGLSGRLLSVVPVAAILYYLRSQAVEEESEGQAAGYQRWIEPAYSYAAAVLVVVLFHFELGRAHAVIGWSAFMLVLLLLAHRTGDRDFRVQGFILGILIFARSWATNLLLEEASFGIPDRILTTLPAITALFVGALYFERTGREFSDQIPARWPHKLRRLITGAPLIYSLLAPALVSIFLYHEVPANFLTLAWGTEALIVLGLGFLMAQRIFRWYGLGLLLVCVIKLFVLDLAGVETVYRILSFIVLGVILLAISFAYTRYRDVIRRYL